MVAYSGADAVFCAAFADAQLPDWRSDYAGMKQEMFYGKVPGFDEIIDVVRRFQDTFNQG